MAPETIKVNPDAAYRGELIAKKLEPEKHEVEKGDTVYAIARKHLGEEASKEELQKHVKEIERINHIDSHSHVIKPGQVLILPGHSDDGGFVLKDAAGNTRTVWQDGTLRLEKANGTGFVRKTADDGSYTEHHWGPQASDNYELACKADGRYLVADRPDAELKEASDPHDVRVAHARLSDLAESRIMNLDELARFRENMDAFESRARKQNLPADEIAKTYAEIEKILEHEGKQPLSEKQRLAIAQQVMDQAAHPDSIDQGFHNTCNVTTVETRLYTRNPSEAARLVSEVTRTGKFTARDGTVVQVGAESLPPDPEAAVNPPHYGARSHASQLFQVTALNMYHQTEAFTYTDKQGVQHNVPPGAMRYEQRKPVPGRADDTGERLVDTTTRPPKVVDKSADIKDDAIVRVNNRLTGEVANDILLCHKDDVYGDASKVGTVGSQEELSDKIARAKAEKKLPLIIRVNTDNEPWLHDSGAGAAGGSGGAHVVTVTDYEPGPPARVQVDNQWGERDDHQGDKAISIHDLYGSMRPAGNRDQIALLQKDVDWDRAHNTIDTRKEFEILRLRHELPATDPQHLNDADFDRLMKEQIKEAGKRWNEQRANRTFNEDEFKNGRRKLGDMVRSQPPDRRISWLGEIRKDGIINDVEYDRSLARAMHDAREKWKAEDKERNGNADERRRAREEMQKQLDALPPERKEAIIKNSK